MRATVTLAAVLGAAALRAGAAAAVPASAGDWLARYFEAETARLEAACLSEVPDLNAWQARREEHRRQLFEMLGLWPLPERTDLKPVIAGRIEEEDFSVERLHFQSLPGLYVTANLYLPRPAPQRAPAVLYACGHAVVRTNGVSCGNKTGYQHHGIWFAQQGYVCLAFDTIQLGEIEGLHHGTYREGMWWWNARGYTPAGVEAWNGMRALDYLVTRPEVDPARIGMTGRSGGGSYTWTTAALDDRIRAAAPVAGITDLRNHVVDGCVAGHCDCMYWVNTYRWDYPLNAALIAPRPLLIVNTDSDPIFPLDGVYRVFEKARRIYRLYGQSTNLGLVIGPGPHRDTQDLQMPVMRWFNQHLKGEDPPIDLAARKRFDPLRLRVFGVLPPDAVNPRIHDSFVARASGPPGGGILEDLRRQCFGGWPAADPAPAPRLTENWSEGGLRFRVIDFESQYCVPQRIWMVELRNRSPRDALRLEVLGGDEWASWSREFGALFNPAGPGAAGGESAERSRAIEKIAVRAKDGGGRLAWTAPRGVGPTAWSGNARDDVQVRRRFMLLGQTLEGMRVWDIRAALAALRAAGLREGGGVTLGARGAMGVNGLYAALYESDPPGLELSALPSSHEQGPDYLNVMRWIDIAAALRLGEARGLRIAQAP